MKNELRWAILGFKDAGSLNTHWYGFGLGKRKSWKNNTNTQLKALSKYDQKSKKESQEGTEGGKQAQNIRRCKGVTMF